MGIPGAEEPAGVLDNARSRRNRFHRKYPEAVNGRVLNAQVEPSQW